MIMRIFALTLTLMLLASSAWCGKGKVLLYGYVNQGNLEQGVTPQKKCTVEEKLNEVTIILYEDGKEIKTMKNRETGFYSVLLRAGKNYKIAFHRDGFISKNISVETASIPEKNYAEAFKIFTDITLFAEMDGKDFTKYSNKIIAKCVYNQSKNRMAWDMDYAREVWGVFLDMIGTMQHQALLEK